MRLDKRAYHAILGTAVLLGVALGGSWTSPRVAVSQTPDTTAPIGPRQDDIPRFHAVGSAPCRTCHRAIWQAWERTRHARAAEPLDFDQRLSPECQPCHLPYDEVESGVGCEACHGPGSAYSPLAVMIDPYKRDRAGLEDPAAGCVECHNPRHPFHRERDLEAGASRVHPVPTPGRPSASSPPGR